MRLRPHVHTTILGLTAAILVTPLFAFFGLRLYDTELVRQTEAELVAQAAFIQAAFGQSYRECLRQQGMDPAEAGIPGKHTLPFTVSEDGTRTFRPVPTVLDMRNSSILGPSVDPSATSVEIDRCAAQAGQRINPLIREAQEVTLSGIRVVDFQGIIAASTRPDDVGQIWTAEEVQTALTGRVAQTLRARDSQSPDPPLDSISRGGGIRVFVAFPIFVDSRVVGAAVVSRTPVSLQKALHANRAIFFGVLLGVFAIAGLAAFFAIRMIGKPVAAMMRQVKNIEEGLPAEPVSNPGTAEFAALSHALSQMDSALRARNTYIQNFARNVSHEFKTPLTSIRGAVELMQDFDTMEPAQRDRFLANIMADTHHLDRLVTRLHELARAESKPRQESRVPIKPILSNLAKSFTEDGFEVSVESEDLNVNVAEEVFISMMRNLLENARQHGAAPAQVRAYRVQNQAVIEVRDAGEGVPQAHTQKIFETFFTTARDHGGTGLGLAIVRALAEQHLGTLELQQDTDGSVFCLKLPLKSDTQQV